MAHNYFVFFQLLSYKKSYSLKKNTVNQVKGIFGKLCLNKNWENHTTHLKKTAF